MYESDERRFSKRTSQWAWNNILILCTARVIIFIYPPYKITFFNSIKTQLLGFFELLPLTVNKKIFCMKFGG